jgi:hypothetical protein
MGLKVAIVGLAPDSRHAVPWDTDFEVWGLAWDADWRYRFDRTFEMHDMADLARQYSPLSAHLERIRECSRLYMAEAYPEVPDSIRFPIEAVEADVGDYLSSSIAYLMTLAIHERAEEISIHGVHMESSGEWHTQRPNMEYLIGFARGRGIKVHIAPESPLCKFVSDTGASYAGRYGKTKG